MPVSAISQEESLLPSFFSGLSDREGLPRRAMFIRRELVQHLHERGPFLHGRLMQTEEPPCPLPVPSLGLYDGAEDMSDGSSDSEDDEHVLEEERIQALAAFSRERVSGWFAPPGLLRPLQSCSFLTVGQTFHGSQRVTSGNRRSAATSDAQDWSVSVRICEVDLRNGRMSGTMETKNGPLGSSEPVLTAFQAEIVDNETHTFLTRKWSASRDTDFAHWDRFEGFDNLRGDAVRWNGHAEALAAAPCIYMRWKETSFVNMPDRCKLTIDGFYYVSLNKRSGKISGFYFDPKAAPFQELSLSHSSNMDSREATCGVSFGSYELR